MKRYWTNYIFFTLVTIILSSCSSALFSVADMRSDKMEQLELGMTKEQVTTILGLDYTIAEKRMEDGNRIEVLSYRNFYQKDEIYLFEFKNDKLEKWDRELVPNYNMKTE